MWYDKVCWRVPLAAMAVIHQSPPQTAHHLMASAHNNCTTFGPFDVGEPQCFMRESCNGGAHLSVLPATVVNMTRPLTR